MLIILHLVIPWDGLVSQEPALCPFLGLVQGPRHLSASIQHFPGTWSLSGTKAQPCSPLHQPQLLHGSHLWGLLGFLINSPYLGTISLACHCHMWPS